MDFRYFNFYMVLVIKLQNYHEQVLTTIFRAIVMHYFRIDEDTNDRSVKEVT